MEDPKAKRPRLDEAVLPEKRHSEPESPIVAAYKVGLQGLPNQVPECIVR